MLSKERAQSSIERHPSIGHHLALEDQSVRFVILNEALHHMEDPFQAMREVARVLTPRREGFLYEPYALNPYRMLSEIRDRLKGSIELSFSVRKLKKVLENAGLRPISIQRHTAPLSDWKMEVLQRLSQVGKKSLFFRVKSNTQDFRERNGGRTKTRRTED